MAYFTSKPCSRVFGYSAIEPKVCQNVGVGRRKSLKTIYGRISYLYDNLEATGWRVFVTRERSTNNVDQNAVSLVRTNSDCKGEVVVHVKQKSTWLYPYFYPCHIALWKSLQLENTSTIEMKTDWKSLQIYHPYIFIDLKKPLNWLKSKITKIEVNLNKTVKHCPKQNIYKFRARNVLYWTCPL